MAKCVASYSQERLFSRLYSNKKHFTCPSLLTRWSVLVLKVGKSYEWPSIKRKLVHSVALTIITLYCFYL